MTSDRFLLISGLLLGLIVPGFLATRLIFREEDIGTVEAFTYSIAFSLAIDIGLGLFLGATVMQKELTGGITGSGLWAGLIVISCVLCLASMVKPKEAGP